MDLQTVVLWVARPACPLAMGLMVWLFLRQSNEAPSTGPTSAQPLSALQKRRAALDAEIAALEVQTSESAPAETAQPIETEKPTA